MDEVEVLNIKEREIHKAIRNSSLSDNQRCTLHKIMRLKRVKRNDLIKHGISKDVVQHLHGMGFLSISGHHVLLEDITNPTYSINIRKFIPLKIDVDNPNPNPNPPIEKDTTMSTNMNTNKMINCLYDNLKAVQVEFSESRGDNKKQYTYKTFEDFEIGDHCVVLSPSGLQVVEVVGTDSSRLEENYQFKWVVQKVDRTIYDQLVEKENAAIETISRMVMDKRRKESIAELEKMIDSPKMLNKITKDLNP